LKGNEPDSLNTIYFRQIYKSIKRHIRKAFLKPLGQVASVKRFEQVSTRVEGTVIKSTEDTRDVFAAAYVQFCLHHDFHIKQDVETRWYMKECLLNEHHSDLKLLASQINIPNQIKFQLIAKILANECYTSFIEYIMRALVQRKHGRMIFDSFYRDRRYDSHWLIDASSEGTVNLHLWSKKPFLTQIARYVRKHGY